jgi:hypothetical protein
LTIWSLIHKNKFAVQMPKFSDSGSSVMIIFLVLFQRSCANPAIAAIAFSHNGKYLAVAERRDCRDFVLLLSCETWELLRVCFLPPLRCCAAG